MDFCKLYIDDGVCATLQQQQQLARIRVRLEANNLTMKVSKSLWGTKKLLILGHVINAEEGSVHEAMLDMAPHESIMVLRSLLGAAGYLSKYVPEYAHLVDRLR